ncbi:hypothetical protein K7X08_000725 [Anisodus acutangulus]|uniref:Uncharacterized protein n=1 Tax=Anisodus acutangulus TaxID=402998 RepID=A0A9Q1M433_9SOLA|nr:hypothetical protein K7X08_000725 [Anisodus acutangulus]
MRNRFFSLSWRVRDSEMGTIALVLLLELSRPTVAFSSLSLHLVPLSPPLAPPLVVRLFPLQVAAASPVLVAPPTDPFACPCLGSLVTLVVALPMRAMSSEVGVYFGGLPPVPVMLVSQLLW